MNIDMAIRKALREKTTTKKINAIKRIIKKAKKKVVMGVHEGAVQDFFSMFK